MKSILKIGAWALAGAIMVMTLGPISERPQFGHPQLERFTAFLTLALLWSASYRGRLMQVLIGLASGAVLLELAQALTPYRDPGVRDVFAKIAGAAVGTGIVGLLRKFRTHQKHPEICARPESLLALIGTIGGHNSGSSPVTHQD